MDRKSLITLEFPQVLERLASYASFALSTKLARTLSPTNDFERAQKRLRLTTEARLLLSLIPEISIGGARDIQASVELAGRMGVLEPSDLLDIRETLVASRELLRSFEKHEDELPGLSEIATNLDPPAGIIDTINQSISERGEILDRASTKLSSVRSEIKICRVRLMDRLENFIHNPKFQPMLQEQLITQRNDRFVIPMKAEFKGKINGIVHDQSSSGATLFIEPIGIIDLNNNLHELQFEERDEELRILALISGQVGESADRIKNIVRSLAEFDFVFMCAKYAEDLHATEPILASINKTKDTHPGSVIQIHKARHPLIDPSQVVPIDLVLKPDVFSLVITGPNTGGKTVTLKTLGLLSLMAQSGLHIPAQSGSKISIFNNIYADIGDEQSIEQSLSTFSGHMTNIIRILRACNSQSLVLLDELGAGTDPQEGASLAQAILDHLIRRSVTCLVATHYPELKIYAHGKPGVVNASMEFNLHSLAPTYHLTIGLPGRSNALLIAESLGLPAKIINNARQGLNPDNLRADDLLDDIHKQRELINNEYEEAKRIHQENEKVYEELSRKMDMIEEERISILENAHMTAENQLADFEEEIKKIRKSLPITKQQPPDKKAVNKIVSELEKNLPQTTRSKVDDDHPMPDLQAGENVRLRKLGVKGKVIAIYGDEVEVLAGALRIRVQKNDIERKKTLERPKSDNKPVTEKQRSSISSSMIHTSPGVEIHLLGKMIDEALESLTIHIESAYLAGLPYIRIVHGKGTGRLRQAVRDALNKSEYVVSWKEAEDNEGGTGATIAKIRNE